MSKLSESYCCCFKMFAEHLLQLLAGFSVVIEVSSKKVILLVFLCIKLCVFKKRAVEDLKACEKNNSLLWKPAPNQSFKIQTLEFILEDNGRQWSEAKNRMMLIFFTL